MIHCTIDGDCYFCDETCEYAQEFEPVYYSYWRKHEWAEEVEEHLIDNFECFRCHNWVRDATPRCPYCGAIMSLED